MRGTLDLLGKIFLFRSCEGAEPGRRSGSPCLDYYIKRCGAPCVGYVTQGGVPRGDRRRGRVPVGPLPPDRARPRAQDVLRGRRAGLRAGRARAQPAAGRQGAAGAPARRHRRLGDVRRRRRRRRRAWRPTRRSSRSATACSSDRQSFYLDNQGEQEPAIVAEEFLLQYYTSALAIPSLIVVQQELAEGSELDVLAELLGERRGGTVEIRAAERGGKRRILELAERNARLALDQEKLKAERRRQQRVESLSGLQRALRARRAARADRVLRHLARRRHAHRRLDGRVRGRRAEEGRLPPLHHSLTRSQRRLRFDERGARRGDTRSGRSSTRSRPTTPTATLRSPRCPTSS